MTAPEGQTQRLRVPAAAFVVDDREAHDRRRQDGRDHLSAERAAQQGAAVDEPETRRDCPHTGPAGRLPVWTDRGQRSASIKGGEEREGVHRVAGAHTPARRGKEEVWLSRLRRPGGSSQRSAAVRAERVNSTSEVTGPLAHSTAPVSSNNTSARAVNDA
jgi:hypothetical protein